MLGVCDSPCLLNFVAVTIHSRIFVFIAIRCCYCACFCFLLLLLFGGRWGWGSYRTGKGMEVAITIRHTVECVCERCRQGHVRARHQASSINVLPLLSGYLSVCVCVCACACVCVCVCVCARALGWMGLCMCLDVNQAMCNYHNNNTNTNNSGVLEYPISNEP